MKQQLGPTAIEEVTKKREEGSWARRLVPRQAVVVAVANSVSFSRVIADARNELLPLSIYIFQDIHHHYNPSQLEGSPSHSGLFPRTKVRLV